MLVVLRSCTSRGTGKEQWSRPRPVSAPARWRRCSAPRSWRTSACTANQVSGTVHDRTTSAVHNTESGAARPSAPVHSLPGLPRHLCPSTPSLHTQTHISVDTHVYMRARRTQAGERCCGHTLTTASSHTHT